MLFAELTEQDTKMNELINPLKTPCYSISSEEFARDYCLLTDEQKLVLFKLRLAYCMKGGPLDEDDIEALFPTEDEKTVSALSKILNRFFIRKNDLYVDERMERGLSERRNQAREIEEYIERKIQLKVERIKAGLLGATKKKTKQMTQNNSSDLTTSKLEENTEQISSKTEANLEANPEANAKQNPSKTEANLEANVEQNLDSVAEEFANTLKSKEKIESREGCGNHEKSVSFDDENPRQNEAVSSRAYAGGCASADSDRINDLNKNINKNNKSASVSDEKTENLKLRMAREDDSKSAAVMWLVEHGLNASTATVFEQKNEKNAERMRALPRLIASLGEQAEKIIERCRQTKAKEGGLFEHSVAFVLTSLERDALRQSKNPKSNSPSTPSVSVRTPGRFSNIDYRAGLTLYPDGTFVLDSKRKS